MIPYIGNLYQIPEFRRFATLMWWKYGGWEEAHDAWRDALLEEYRIRGNVYPESRIITELIAKLVIELEAEYAKSR
jgi:hypothetical protein